MKPSLNFSILNMDKSAGPSSFSIDTFVKKSLNLKKTSHFGTLDPQVTGVLPVALGRACRLNEYFMHSDKSYVGIMHLREKVTKIKLEAEMKKFIGVITQLPPIKSAVARRPRQREIFEFKILEKSGQDVLFSTKVQAGTYIRKLVHDLGLQIGGAHMLELRRTQASVFKESDPDFINLYDFEKALKEDKLSDFLISGEEAIKRVLPEIQLSNKNITQILNGKPLMLSDLKTKTKLPSKFAAFVKDKFIGVYHSVSEGDIIAKPEFVYN